jgi:hypothetical protein
MSQEFHESILRPTSPWGCSPTCLCIDVIIRIRTTVYEIVRRFIARKWESAEQTGTRYTRMQVPYEGDRKLAVYTPKPSGGQQHI